MTSLYKNSFRAFMAFLLMTSFSFTGSSQIIPELKCDGNGGFEVADLSGFQSTTTDSAGAVRQYAKFAASSTKTICTEPDECTGNSSCTKVSTGGNFPTPKQNDLGYWDFPKDPSVTVNLKCVCQATTKVDIIDGDIVELPIDPFADDDNSGDAETENRRFDFDSDVLVYPNPVQSDLKVDFSQFDQKGKFEIRIFNALGTLMQIESVDISDNNQDIFDIRTSDYTSGMYYLVVTDQSSIITSTKFMVSQE